MQRTTSRQLYDYWNSVRSGRPAPQRFDIEPAKIAPLLPETFILECGGPLGFRFRLAGTRICEHFGRELRGEDFLTLWSARDGDAIRTLTTSIVTEKAIGAMRFDAFTDDDRSAPFEMLLLPLTHLGASVTRIMGAATSIDPPYWLGTAPLTRLAVLSFDLDWPARRAAGPDDEPQLAILSDRRPPVVRDIRRQFRVVEGGLQTVED